MKTVLVADDSTIIQKSIDISLSHSDVNVIYASSAGEAWKLSQENQADIFILDVSMPDKNGLELCKELRSLPQYSQTPIIMLASAQNPMDQSELEKIGAQDIVLKPFETSEISEKVHGYLNHLSSPPTRDEESFFTPKYKAENIQPSPANPSNVAGSDSTYDIGFSSVDDIALTDSEATINHNSNPINPNASNVESEISDFAFDNSELSGINNSSQLDTIANSDPMTQTSSFDFSATAVNESTDIKFNHDFSSPQHKVLEVSADSFNQIDNLDIQDPLSSNIESENSDFSIKAAPIETSTVDPIHMQKTEAEIHKNQFDATSQNSFNQSNPSSETLQLSDQQIESIVTKVFENVIERIAWEVVPDIAEKMIREEISRLTKD